MSAPIHTPDQSTATPTVPTWGERLKRSSSLVTRSKVLTLPRRYFGVSVATFAASVLAYLTLIDVGTLPPAGEQRLFAVVGVCTLALVIGIAANATAIAQVRSNAVASAKYTNLQERLAPMLYAGMEAVVQYWAEGLTDGLDMSGLNISVDSELEFQLHVFIRIQGHYRIVASSAEPASPVRWLELEENEGMLAAVHERRSAVVAVVEDQFSAKLFTPTGHPIGEQERLRPKNAGKCNAHLKWIYGTPIFENRTNVYWSDRPLGVLTVDGLNSMSDQLYLKPEFQGLFDDVAAQLAPYLNTLESLLDGRARSPTE